MKKKTSQEIEEEEAEKMKKEVAKNLIKVTRKEEEKIQKAQE